LKQLKKDVELGMLAVFTVSLLLTLISSGTILFDLKKNYELICFKFSVFLLCGVKCDVYTLL